VGGTYLPGTDQHLLTVSTDKPASDWQALFHEYTHLVIQQTLRQVPPWFDEGLAEFHATVVFGGNGRRAEVGRAHEAHLRLLRREPMLPVLELLATTRDDALYNEGDRRGMFYAQSWLLVHYLLGGDGSRATSAFGYLDEIQRGATVEQALDRALRTTPALLEKDLGDYLQRSPFTARVVALPSSASQPGAAATPLSLADANAWRGELLLRLDRRHEARQRLEQALGLDGQHPRALAALGRLAAVEQQFSEARNTLARAAALAPHDPVIQVRFARAALDQARLGDRTAGGLPEDVRVAEVAARRALAALPTMAEAHAVLATAALARRDADVATAETRRAIDLAPARDDLRLLLAHAHLAANRRAEALALLRDLVERAQPPRLRADAARLLEQTESAIRDKAAGPGRQPRH
jgi:Flp pilus assembly protein TadD